MFSLENEEIVNLAIERFLGDRPGELLHWLHEALGNSSATIRSNAARALGKMKSRGSTPYLMDLLEDERWDGPGSAAEALGLIGDRVCIEALVERIQDNVEKVQEQAAGAIVLFGRQATVPLLNVLARERDKFAQRALLKCLGRIGDPKSVPALIGYLRSSYFIVRQAAVSALVRFGPGVTELLLPVLSYNTSDIEAAPPGRPGQGSPRAPDAGHQGAGADSRTIAPCPASRRSSRRGCPTSRRRPPGPSIRSAVRPGAGVAP